jgi:hypothetical protein
VGPTHGTINKNVKEAAMLATVTTDGNVAQMQHEDWTRVQQRIAELEAALREIAGGEISGHGEIVVRSDSMTIAHEALEKKNEEARDVD